MYGSRWLNDVIAGCVRPRGSLDTVVRLVSWLEPGRPSNCGLIPGGGKGLLLLNVQTCSGAHPASCSMGIGLCFLSGTATGLTNRPSGAEVKNEWSHTCTRLHSVDRENFIFYLLGASKVIRSEIFF